MRKIILAALIAFVLSAAGAYALEPQLLEMRNKFFQEAAELKSLPVTPKNVVVINSMWDTCLMTMTQLDAYFYMLGIFNSVNKEDTGREALDYLTSWLNEIKRVNELNIKSLRSILQLNDPTINTHMERLRIYYTDLNNRLDAELKKVSALTKTLKQSK